MVIKVSEIDELLKNEKVEWKKVSEVISQYKEKQKNDSKINLVYTVSKDFGIISSIDYWIKNNEGGKYINYSEDISNYNIIRKNMFAYNPSRLNIGSIDCLFDKPEGVLSPMYVIFQVDERIINPKYLLFYLKSEKVLNLIDSKKEQGARFRFDFERWNFIKIPIPSLKTQEKIVETLDKFTNYVTELQARNKQYSYYRDLLLSEDCLNKLSMKFEFTNFQVKCQNLDDITYISSGGDIPKESYSNVRTEKFNIPIISNGVGENAIYGFTDKAKINEDAVTISARGTIGYAQYRNYPFYPVVRLLSLVVKDKSNVNTKYLYYLMQDKKYNLPPTGIPQLTIPMLKKIKVILPSIEIQNKVVEVLDRFEELIENSRGLLPEEIEKRQKQYEYYREKLLTFDKMCDNIPHSAI